jgi:hypothetical protein
LWSLYLFDLALARKSKSLAFGFGLSFAATWAARPNGALFIGLPLLTLLVHHSRETGIETSRRLFPYAVLGLFMTLLPIYRPTLVMKLLNRSDVLFSDQYFFGRYVVSTTETALTALTPVLVILALAGVGILLVMKKRFVVLFCCLWIVPVYLFYTGMGCRHRYFLALLPPCLLLAFAAAGALDREFEAIRKYHLAKLFALVLLLSLGLAPDIIYLNRLRTSRDHEIIGRGIGEVVGQNLLLATSEIPLIQYYNRDHPPETIYFLFTYRPDSVKVRIEHVDLVQHRLRMGFPVFATEIVIKHLRLPGFDIEAKPVWEYHSIRVFQITKLVIRDTGMFGYANE